MSWTHIATHTPVHTPDYRWDLDEYRNDAGGQMLFAHIAVHKFRPGLLKQMQETYRLFRQHVHCPLYAVGEKDDAKWARFVALFDFNYLMDVVCNNGEPRRMFVSYAKEQQHGQQFTAAEPNPEHQPDDHRIVQHEPVGRANPVSAARVQRRGKRPHKRQRKRGR